VKHQRHDKKYSLTGHIASIEPACRLRPLLSEANGSTMALRCHSLIPPIPPVLPVRRKVFVSYFRGDRLEVEEFVERWAEDERVFLPQIVGAFGRGLIKSSNAEYVISRIRTEQIADATVTLVLLGSCTHSRRHVDWEIQASLRRGADSLPNGLLGIVLPSQGKAALLPPRFEMNWVPENRGGYARYYVAPSSAIEFRAWI
jgi:MTH538 TIR-like domain (DUF1863)